MEGFVNPLYELLAVRESLLWIWGSDEPNSTAFFRRASSSAVQFRRSRTILELFRVRACRRHKFESSFTSNVVAACLDGGNFFRPRGWESKSLWGSQQKFQVNQV